jgi:hypothetical protein
MRPARRLAPSGPTQRWSGTAARLIVLACLARPDGVARAAGDDLPTCPPGWEVEVVVASPRVLHPTAVACAPDGRVFICED